MRKSVGRLMLMGVMVAGATLGVAHAGLAQTTDDAHALCAQGGAAPAADSPGSAVRSQLAQNLPVDFGGNADLQAAAQAALAGNANLDPGGGGGAGDANDNGVMAGAGGNGGGAGLEGSDQGGGAGGCGPEETFVPVIRRVVEQPVFVQRALPTTGTSATSTLALMGGAFAIVGASLVAAARRGRRGHVVPEGLVWDVFGDSAGIS
jgi:LPXTG-motif cell wall-anchored protein